MSGTIVSPDAQRDLQEIISYIGAESVEGAARVFGKFEEVFRLLAENPYVGHRRADLTVQPVRFFPVYSYLVVYRLVGSRPEVIRVFGAAQDVARLLEPDSS
ncbi:type II toxin-antitoxin system RelE/ParE family toxin [bacterium]|nr:type II toxin-antitoxin system RelE/ParE family toxin [bacterium]